VTPDSLPPSALVAAAGALLERAIAGDAGTLAALFAQTTLVIGSAQAACSRSTSRSPRATGCSRPT
jgi:hypothetical protein